MAVVLIGTNNLSSDPPGAMAAGIQKIIEEIPRQSPGTKVLLLGLFPRSETADALRQKVAKVNALLARLADDRTVFYLDLGNRFLRPDGVLTKEIMPDFVHPSVTGYQIWADAMQPTLERLMSGAK